jgi:hypothetical protein
MNNQHEKQVQYFLLVAEEMPRPSDLGMKNVNEGISPAITSGIPVLTVHNERHDALRSIYRISCVQYLRN